MNAPVQLDLFASIFPASNEVEKIDTLPALPSRSWEWDLMLGRAAEALALRIHVSHRWTGVVLEQVVDRTLGRRILWVKGNVTRYPAPPGRRSTRTIHMSADAAAELHRRMPLVRHDWGDGWAQFRPAEAGEAFPVMLVPLSNVDQKGQ